jgi:hypothetical protein
MNSFAMIFGHCVWIPPSPKAALVALNLFFGISINGEPDTAAGEAILASPMTSSRSWPFSHRYSSVNKVTHCHQEQGMRVMSVPQNIRSGPKASKQRCRCECRLRNGYSSSAYSACAVALTATFGYLAKAATPAGSDRPPRPCRRGARPCGRRLISGRGGARRSAEENTRRRNGAV